MMDIIIREERGWAGHFICANRCRFRRNTLLARGERRIVVSTVGAMESGRFNGFEEIGYNRYYETMAFEAGLEAGYWDAEVDKQIYFDSPWAISSIDADADRRANDMHERVVAEITASLAAC
jgi:hypothetical protein